MLRGSFRRLVVLCAVLVAGCGTTRYAFDYAAEPDPRKSEYVVGPGDKLAIVVWRNPDLTGEVQVRPDGTITMPLLGDFTASGKTPTQVQKEILKKLGTLFNADTLNVTITVREVNSYRFTVTGNVMRPGVLTVPTYVTVLEAVELSGGPTKRASADETVIVRKDVQGNVRRIPINYETLKSGEDLAQNVVVLRGDVIHVP